MEQILKEIGSTSIYAHPALFAKRFSLKKGNMVYTGMCLSQKDLETRFGVKFHLYEEITEISPSVYMTGLVPFSNGIETISDRFKVESAGTLNQDTFLDDNSLVLDTSKGLVVILGCAHRGVVNILTHVKNKFQKPIWAIIGGTHLHKVNQQRFDFTLDYIRNENIQLIAPAHCTGIERIFELKNYFGDKVQPAFCGETFYI